MTDDGYGPGRDFVYGDIYAFRTFTVLDGRLASIGAGQTTDGQGGWINGICEAHCRLNAEHQAPVRDCGCGVYAFYTIDHLLTHTPSRPSDWSPWSPSEAGSWWTTRDYAPRPHGWWCTGAQKTRPTRPRPAHVTVQTSAGTTTAT